MTVTDKTKRLFGYNFKTYVFKGSVLAEMTAYCMITVLITNPEIPNPDDWFKSDIILWDTTPVDFEYSKVLGKSFAKWRESKKVGLDRHKIIIYK